MATLLSEDFERGSNGADLSIATTGFDLISAPAPTFSNTWSRNGSLSMAVLNTTSALKYVRKNTTGALLYTRFWLYLGQLPGAIAYVAQVGLAPDTTRGQVRINTNGTLRMRNVFTAVGSDSIALSVGTPYQVLWKTDSGAGKQSLNLYDAAGSLLYASGDQTMPTSAFDQVRLGLAAAAANQAIYLDDVLLATTDPGPVVAAPSATGNFFQFL